MRRITVRIVRTKRDGIVLKWTDPREGPKQMRARGRTQRQVDKEARELEDELNRRKSRLTWDDFDKRYRESYLGDMSEKHRNKTRAMVEKVKTAAKAKKIDPLYCADLSPDLILEVESAYRMEGVADATVRSAMGTLWSMLGWGMDAKIIPYFRRPRQRKGKKAKKQKKSKGRSLTLEEIERMEAKIPEVCNKSEDPSRFVLAMTAMRLIGLRLSDCWHFRWDPQEGAHYPINLDSRSPMIYFSDSQKSGEEGEVPLTGEAAAWLRSIRQESGWVCRSTGRYGEHKTEDRLCRVIAEAGKAAGVVVKATGGKKGAKKFASSHDLRRTFAMRLIDSGLTVPETQFLTRHADAQTLLDYYTDSRADAIATRLRKYAEGVLADESGGEHGGEDSLVDPENVQKTSKKQHAQSDSNGRPTD